jgi:ABC-type uncharacterized transport system substrate-binding protein
VKRRQFITLLGGAVATWPLAAHAQQGERARWIGVLIGVAEDAETKAWVATFHKRLDELGWRVGGNLQIEERWTAGDPDRNRRFAGELVAAKPDVIFAFSSVAVAALLQESHTVPIVFTAISDPVGSGFVESLARPGRNATGFTNFVPTMAAKWLEVLKEIAPQVRRAVLLFNPQTAPYVAEYYQRPFEAAAPSFGVQAIAAVVHQTGEIEAAIADMAREPAGGLVVPPDNIRVGGSAPPARSLSVPVYGARGRVGILRGRFGRNVSARGRIYRSYSEGHKAGRSSGAGANQVRVGDQPQDCKGARPHGAADAARPRRRGDRVKRRAFIVLLGTAAAWPLAARAQQPAVLVIEFLDSHTPDE